MNVTDAEKLFHLFGVHKVLLCTCRQGVMILLILHGVVYFYKSVRQISLKGYYLRNCAEVIEKARHALIYKWAEPVASGKLAEVFCFFTHSRNIHRSKIILIK